MHRDVPVPTLRLLLRIANAFALDFLTIARGGRDFADALIISALMQSKAARLGRDPHQQRLYALFDTPVPGPLRRALSINAMATSLSLPFETVRRRTKRLMAEGLCEATPEGIQVSESFLRSPAHRLAVEEAYRTTNRLYIRIARANCLAAMALPPFAEPFAPDAEPPVRIVWRAACDYFLRLMEVLPAVSTVTQAFILMEVVRGNTEAFSDEMRGGDAAVAFVPDVARKPVGAAEVADRLGLPRETARRNLLLLLEDGRVRRAPGGYIVPLANLAQPRAIKAWNSNFLSLCRMFGDLAQTGVLARWDSERPEVLAAPAAPAADLLDV